MTVADIIREKLTAAMSPVQLSVDDESALHAGHAGARPGGETHFRVRIVSRAFEAQPRVIRHRQVYAVLRAEIEGGVHALALTTLTPAEAERSRAP